MISGRGSLTLALHGPSSEEDKGLRKFARLRGRLYSAEADVEAEDEEEDEESLGYEDDFSIGIDLPLANDTTSGQYKLMLKTLKKLKKK